MSENGIMINGTATRWLLGLLTLLLSVMIGTLVTVNLTMRGQIRELELFMARTDGNRFTDDEARQLQRDLILYHDSNTPPGEVRFQLDDHEARLQRLERGR